MIWKLQKKSNLKNMETAEEKYGRKTSWRVIKYGQNRRKVGWMWNDMENMAEK